MTEICWRRPDAGVFPEYALYLSLKPFDVHWFVVSCFQVSIEVYGIDKQIVKSIHRPCPLISFESNIQEAQFLNTTPLRVYMS